MKAKKIISSMVLSAIIAGSIGFKVFANEEGNFNAKIVTVANTVSYLTIDAKSLDSGVKALYLDGKEYKFSNVSDDGKIIKVEFNGKHKVAKIILNNGNSYERKIEGVYNKFPYSAGTLQKAPDLVWGHVTIPVWDFHNIAKDENGKEITKPLKTTFKVNEEAKPIDVISTPTINITNRIEGIHEGKYHIQKGKDVVFVFDLNNKDEKKAYLRLQGFEFRYKDKTYVIKAKKSKDGNVASVTLPAKGFNTFKLNSEESLIARLAGRKPIVLKLYLHHPKKEIENPNPIEVTDDNVLDYGKNIEYSFDLNNATEKQKFDRFTEAVKVYSDGHEESLTTEKSKSGSEGKIRVLFASSRPIQNTGSQEIKLTYRGLDPDVKKVVIKKKSPVILLNSNSGDYKVNKSLLFTLRGFDYLFQQDTGVESVYINGAKLERKYVPNDDEDLDTLRNNGVDAIENESGNGFHVVGNLLRIKNDGKNLIHEGVNFITVKYKNYHDSTLKFVVSGEDKKANSSKPKKRTRRAVNVVSSATTGGVSKPSVGSSDSSSGGTINQGATLLYDFDMVSNASIIENLGYKNPQAKRLLDFFEGTAKEVAVYRNNPNRKVVWDSYMNFVQSNRLNYGKYKSFAEYYNDPSVETTNNSPYQLKYVIGGNLGKPIIGFEGIFTSDGVEKDIPKSVSSKLDNIDIRSDIVLPLNNWTKDIEYISINGQKLEPNNGYKVDLSNNEIVIPNKLFSKEGTYKLVIKANGYKEYTKDLLVKSEKDEDTTIRVVRDSKLQNKLFTGEDLNFVVEDPSVKVTGVYLTVNDGDSVEINSSNGLSYIPTQGSVKIDKKYVKTPGKYKVRFYFTRIGYKDIEFNVVGDKLDFVKAPINESLSKRMKQNAYSFTFENYTGNREVSKWLSSINSVQVGNDNATKISKQGKDEIYPTSLSYIVVLDNDKTFDSGSYFRVVSPQLNKLGTSNDGNEDIKIRVKAEGYADVIFKYSTVGIRPAEDRDVEIYQVKPNTDEKIFSMYSKAKYLDPVEDSVVADFDEAQMKKDFPGMVLDRKNSHLYNNGEFKKANDFFDKITRVEINGKRISFGSTGMYIDGFGEKRIRFMAHKFVRGDKITVYSTGYPVYKYLVR